MCLSGVYLFMFSSCVYLSVFSLSRSLSLSLSHTHTHTHTLVRACALSLSLFGLEDARRGVHVDKASLPFGC
jgi:hypothetical protein